MVRENLYYVANQVNFEESLKTLEFEDLFYDRFGGVFGHFTLLGSEHVSDNIIEAIERHNLTHL